MEAMPPLDYDQFATKQDVANLGIELRAEIGGLRGDMTGLESGLRGDMALMESRITSEMGKQFLLDPTLALPMKILNVD